ncbi:hypothetical protein PBR_0901 [Segatella baroniae B14]|uniref:Uncharacterized protein n=1 Tax=Segatella baroniae B14 TaxID=752555 RepID=D8DVA1_9BACT|nr:hypothetical protein PBR_0901 [Segatella baroniae B14]
MVSGSLRSIRWARCLSIRHLAIWFRFPELLIRIARGSLSKILLRLRIFLVFSRIRVKRGIAVTSTSTKVGRIILLSSILNALRLLLSLLTANCVEAVMMYLLPRLLISLRFLHQDSIRLLFLWITAVGFLNKYTLLHMPTQKILRRTGTVSSDNCIWRPSTLLTSPICKSAQTLSTLPWHR